LNPDCLLPPEALSDMMAAFDEVPGAVLAGCWLQNPDCSEREGTRRELLTLETGLSEATGLYRLIGMKRLSLKGRDMPRETHEVPAISGAFMCIRKTHYERIGG